MTIHPTTGPTTEGRRRTWRPSTAGNSTVMHTFAEDTKVHSAETRYLGKTGTGRRGGHFPADDTSPIRTHWMRTYDIHFASCCSGTYYDTRAITQRHKRVVSGTVRFAANADFMFANWFLRHQDTYDNDVRHSPTRFIYMKHTTGPLASVLPARPITPPHQKEGTNATPCPQVSPVFYGELPTRRFVPTSNNQIARSGAEPKSTNQISLSCGVP